MRQGGAKAKGSLFERQVGVMLSLWLTSNEREDLFSRNVLSGGRFTTADKKGTILGIPGDLMPAHPLAFDFISLFLVECKHRKEDVDIEELFFRGPKSFLGKVFNDCIKLGSRIGVHTMVVARKNYRPTVVIVEADVGDKMLRSASNTQTAAAFQYHWLYRQQYFVTLLADMVDYVDPMLFLQMMKRELLPYA